MNHIVVLFRNYSSVLTIFSIYIVLFTKDSLFNPHESHSFYNSFEKDEVKGNDDDDSLSTTDSDHMELLKIIKKRKAEKKLMARDKKTKHLSTEQATEKSHQPYMKLNSSNVISFDEESTLNISTVATERVLPSTEVTLHSNEHSLRDAFKDVWKDHQGSTGGYQVKLYVTNTPSYAKYIPLVLDIMNTSGQVQIYLKSKYIVEVLKVFLQQMQRKFPQLLLEMDTAIFMDTIMNCQQVDLRDVSHGANKYRCVVKDKREYKDYIILFMAPRHLGEPTVVANRLKTCLFNVLSSDHFFVLMESYFSTIPGEGGKIGVHLKNKDSESWNIIRNIDNYLVTTVPSLDAKLMDADINSVLERMFPGESYKEGFQQIGWKHKVSTPFIKREKL